MQPELSIIIPALNEQERIKPTLKAYSSWLKGKFKSSELIVAVDGYDGTANIAKKFGAKVISSSKKTGKGAAIINGIKHAGGKWVAYVDADNSISPKEFEKLWKERKNAELVITSRYLPGASRNGMPLLRHVQSRVFNLLVRILFGLEFDDTQCGTKLMRKEKIMPILSKIQSRRYVFDVELLAKAKKEGIKINAVPIIWNYMKDSRIGIFTPFLMLSELILLRLLMH
ncbi:MAG: glycosyltransferase [Candidatus Micrarchaeota archaeon]